MQPDASSRALLSRVLLPIFRASCAVAVHAQSPLLLPNALGGVEQGNPDLEEDLHFVRRSGANRLHEMHLADAA